MVISLPLLKRDMRKRILVQTHENKDALSKGKVSEFRDVVFEDAVFDNNICYLILYLDVT